MAKTLDLKKLHQQALERFRLVAQTEDAQRKRELEDLAFQAGDQWEEDVKQSRRGSDGSDGTQAIPPRPMITVRALDQPIAQVVNQARNARYAITVAPKADGADQATAEILGGICRAFEYESHAQTAYLWAYERAVTCGRGYFRINKAMATDADGADQVLRVEMILNGACVYLDPWAQNVNDPKAARWGFITEDLPEERYKDQYGDVEGADPGDLLSAVGDSKYTWVTADTVGKPVYRVAEYFFLDGERDDTNAQMYWSKINGVGFIDAPQEWDGRYIPIVPMVGREMNIGGARVWEGMVAPNKGPCRVLNYMVSSTAEQVGLASRAPWIGYTGQFEGHPEWDVANVRNLNKLEANATTDATGANVLPLPVRNTAEPPIQALNQCVAMFTNFIRSTTGVPDAALGHVNPNDRSGKAIAALQQASEQGTSNYPDNLQRAITHGGEVMIDLIPKVCDRPGRVIEIITGQDEKRQTVMLGQKFVRHQGKPVPFEKAPPPQPGQPPQVPEMFDLAKGQYTVVVDVGKSFATRRQETAASLGALAAAAPELVPKFADLWVKSMDIPESNAIAERLAPPGAMTDLPPAMQAIFSQLQQQNQQLTQAIQTKQVEQQADIEKAKIQANAKLEEAKMDNDSRERIAFINSVANLSAVDAKVDAESARTFVDAAEKRISKVLDIHMERVHQLQDQLHQAKTQASDQEHEAGMAVLGHALAPPVPPDGTGNGQPLDSGQ